MGFYEVVRAAADAGGLSLAEVARRMGRGPSYITGNMARGSAPRVDTAAAMLGACGWSLVAVPSEDVPPSALVVEPPDADQDAERRALERRRARLAAELAAVDERLG